MFNLLVFFESFTNGFKPEMLGVLSLLSILCGILIIISKNPIAQNRAKALSLWDKLSNSGKALKLVVPNHSRKVISG